MTQGDIFRFHVSQGVCSPAPTKREGIARTSTHKNRNRDAARRWNTLSLRRSQYSKIHKTSRVRECQ